MQKHCIGLRWSDTGKGLLTPGKSILAETINVSDVDPCFLTHSYLNTPPRRLVVLNS